jgi:hypothetical protein
MSKASQEKNKKRKAGGKQASTLDVNNPVSPSTSQPNPFRDSTFIPSKSRAKPDLLQQGAFDRAFDASNNGVSTEQYKTNLAAKSKQMSDAREAHDTVSAAPDVKTKIGGIGEESKKAAAAATADEGFFSGISGAFKKDGQTIRNSLGRMSDALNQEDTIAKMTKEGANKAAIEAFKADNKFSKIGGDFLDEFGGGSKAMGGAKLGAYVVGGSMLVDFLNPFDDD